MQSVASSGRSIVATNFFVSFLLGTSLQSLWSTISVMQLIFFLGLIELRHQANLQFFYNLLAELLNIEMVKADQVGLIFN